MTLIELIIVITIIGILVVALAFEFTGWVEGYKIEKQAKEMYVDLMNARIRAMQRNRAHFATLTTTQYKIYEDIYPAPDGDGQLTSGTSDCLCSSTCSLSDCLVMQKILDAPYPITWSDIADTRIEFTARGLSNDDKTICINIDLIEEDPSRSGADYDCIIITSTRINLGQLTKSIPDGGVCASTTSGGNCVAK